MDRALDRDSDIAIEPPDQQLADLAGAPARLLALEPDDQVLDRLGQLVGVAHRPAGPIGQGLQPVPLVAVENLVAGLAGDAELPAHLRHRLPVQQAGHKAQAFLHHRTRSPRHRHPPPKGEKCCPCVRYDVSPMSQAAHVTNILCRLSSMHRGPITTGFARKPPHCDRPAETQNSLSWAVCLRTFRLCGFGTDLVKVRLKIAWLGIPQVVSCDSSSGCG